MLNGPWANPRHGHWPRARLPRMQNAGPNTLNYVWLLVSDMFNECRNPSSIMIKLRPLWGFIVWYDTIPTYIPIRTYVLSPIISSSVKHMGGPINVWWKYFYTVQPNPPTIHWYPGPENPQTLHHWPGQPIPQINYLFWPHSRAPFVFVIKGE